MGACCQIPPAPAESTDAVATLLNDPSTDAPYLDTILHMAALIQKGARGRNEGTKTCRSFHWTYHFDSLYATDMIFHDSLRAIDISQKSSSHVVLHCELKESPVHQMLSG